MSGYILYMATALDLKGKRFGSLTAAQRYENDDAGRAQWLCICDCGGAHIVRASYLNTGVSVRCPECARVAGAVHIEAWYHVTIQKDVLSGFGQGSAGFCAAMRGDTNVLTLEWIDKPHRPGRVSPVLVAGVRALATAGTIKCPTDSIAIHRWIRRNRDKITVHSFNEGDQVRAEWKRRTGVDAPQ